MSTQSPEMGGPAPQSWREVLAATTSVLGSAEDARHLVCEASGWSGAELVVGLDGAVPARAGAYLTQMVDRRLLGEPLQYALGRWGFRALDLMVDGRVLIPRPETEQVVEAALVEARRLARQRPGRDLQVADLGTGSGAVALSLATEGPRAQVWATDISADALEVAGANLAGLAGLAAARVRLVLGSWFAALPESLRGGLDLVVSNPPYVGDGEDLDPSVEDWEPRTALRAGATGLEHLEEIVVAAPDWLTVDGVLVVELAPAQAEVVRGLAVATGFAEVEVGRDLAGRDRMVIARLAPAAAGAGAAGRGGAAGR